MSNIEVIKDNEVVENQGVSINIVLPDLMGLIRDSINSQLAPVKLRAVIDKCCKDVIENAITSQFGYNGDIKKQLVAHITEKIGIDPAKLPVPEYTKLIAQGFSQALEGMEDEKIRSEAKELMDNILDTAPKEIKLSELAELYIETIKQDYGYHMEDNKEVETEYDDHGMYKEYELIVVNEPRYPESPILNGYRNIRLYCPELKRDEHNLYIDVEYLDDNTDKATFKDACYANRLHSSVSKMDLKDWSTSSKLQQLLYKMAQKGTVIELDGGKIPEYVEVRIECDCG